MNTTFFSIKWDHKEEHLSKDSLWAQPQLFTLAYGEYCSFITIMSDILIPISKNHLNYEMF